MRVNRRTMVRGLAGAAVASALSAGAAKVVDAPSAAGAARAADVPTPDEAAAVVSDAREAAASGASPGAVEGSAFGAIGDTGITRRYVEFARQLRFEALPDAVVHAAKRFVLDSLGCALAGWQTDKARKAAGVMLSAGGNAEATDIGADTRQNAATAAFANAELMNALDYDAIPHTPPVTLPAVLAMAEKTAASGKDLIGATVIAHELAARLSSASSQMSASIQETGKTPDVFGINNEAIIATAAACASLAHLDAGGVASAIGLAAYYCPPQVAHDWETGSPKSNVKYTPVGMVSHGAVTAALLSQAGYTGNPHALDGPVAFATYYGYRKWKAENATRDLGQTWRIQTVDFKPYACCRYIHSQIDCLEALLRKHQVRPQDIESIHSSGPPFNANPDPRNVRTQEDAQFSIPYMLALVASGIPLDARCQRRELLADADVRRMMGRIQWDTLPRNSDPKMAHAARVEARARGRQYVEKTSWPRGSASLGAALSDDELTRKFEANASIRVAPDKARQLVQTLWKLDTLSDVRTLAQMLHA
jgi:2-methylcitrate dehydratase PrpD